MNDEDDDQELVPEEQLYVYVTATKAFTLDALEALAPYDAFLMVSFATFLYEVVIEGVKRNPAPRFQQALELGRKLANEELAAATVARNNKLD